MRSASRRSRWTAACCALTLVPLAGTTPSAALPWGPNGHRITARLAERHLNEKAAAAVRRILGGKSLAQVATWPDQIRSDPAWDFTKTWHYITVEDHETYAEVMERAAEKPTLDNVAEAIAFFERVLGRDPAAEKELVELLASRGVEPLDGSIHAMALAFLVHCVGDIHQPLHVGRGADRGGNGVQVLWFDEPTNLHKVWDEELIGSEQLSFSEFAGFLLSPAPEVVAAWQKAPVADWAQESIALRGEVYDLGTPAPPEGELPPLGYVYAYRKLPLVKTRLLHGGVRLAGRLNALLGG